jgi:hypothetical protein
LDENNEGGNNMPKRRMKQVPSQKRKQVPSIPFSLGCHVRVKKGVVHPDYEYIPLGGWLGKVIDDEDDFRYIQWTKETLEAVPPVYLQRCERDDWDHTGMWLPEEQLEADPGEPLSIEQPKKTARERGRGNRCEFGDS